MDKEPNDQDKTLHVHHKDVTEEPGLSEPTPDVPEAEPTDLPKTFDPQPIGPEVVNAPGKKRKLKKWMIIVIILLVVALISGVAYYIYSNNTQKKVTPVIKPVTKKVVSVRITPDVTWMEPKQVGNLDLFNLAKYNDYGVDQILYYKIADKKGGSEIYLVLAQCGFAPCNYRFQKTGDKYYFLKNESDEMYPALDFLKSTVVIDSKTTYPELEFPKTITLKNGATFANAFEQALFSGITNTKLLEKTQYGSFYEQSDNNDNKLVYVNNRDFYLKLADSTVRKYSMNLDYYNREDYIPKVTIDGVTNKTAYANYIIPGCGRFDSTVLKTPLIDKTTMVDIGTTSTGHTVFGISNVDSPLAKELYSLYKEISNSDAFDSTFDSLKNLTISQFYALHPRPVFIVPDSTGEYIVYLRNEFKGAGGCGKPVIYLYPQQKTQVSVKVGADVSVSIPDYNKGWKVIAYPDGTIIDNGKSYDSLFWEGQGNGSYPKVDKGFVVKQADLKSTLQAQLTKLSLNDKESSDFISFWMTKLPTTPYVRLSWLMTRDMNQVAPLSITPTPKTIIRVFLDYQGLQKPVEIKPQVLTSIPREGFTIVEWGGLKTW